MKQRWRALSLGGKLAWLIIAVWMVLAAISYLPGITAYQYDKVLGGSSSLLPPMSVGPAGTHWLGTDSIGRDVAAGMIHGAGVSLLLCIIVIAMSVVIGLGIGMAMGYYGDRGIRLNIIQYIWLLALAFFLVYYKSDILLRGYSWWSGGMVLLGSTLLIGGMYGLRKLPLRKYILPFDSLWQRVFEVKESLPSLFLLLAVTAIVAQPSIWTLAMTLVLLYWVTFARFARVEMQQIVNEDYISAAQAQGLSTLHIMIRHVLPNLIGPVLVVIAFSLSGVILVEASLSFLGLGLPLGEVTWGKLLAEARKHSSAWWLALYPGLAIFALIFAFNKVADIIRDGSASSR